MVGTTLNHYRILEPLGSGGMGEVYAAEDLKLRRRVALKVLPSIAALDPERRARLEHEAQAIAALNHPNIVIVHSVELTGDVPFMTMELVEGRTLADEIPRGGLPINRVLAVGIALADAMTAVHQRNIFHRDLKPANVMILPDGRIKMLDFGLAKLQDDTVTDAVSSIMPTRPPTLEGRIVGTVSYMSPEQAEGRPVDRRSDIFSFGVVLFELATGDRPFNGESNLSILLSIIKDAPPVVSEVNRALPKELGRIVKRCLAKDPNRRYQDAVDLRTDLEELRQTLDAGRSNEAGRALERPFGRTAGATGPPADRSESPVVGTSLLFQRVLTQAAAVASTDAAVLIRGESGVGKELIARRIHDMSSRHWGPFVRVDCASAAQDHPGRETVGHDTLQGPPWSLSEQLAAADGGTLLLDRIEELPADFQTKLLKPLQESTVDVRFIAATNGDLAEHVAQGRFRRDLYFRVSVFPIEIPPLRARPEDIPVLVEHFLDAHGATLDRESLRLSEAQQRRLQAYDWPGNVRELKNVVERAVILAGEGPLSFDEALPNSAFSFPARAPLPEERVPVRGFLTAREFEQSERNNLVGAMEAAGWRAGGPEGAAVQLGMSLSRLRSRLKALHIKKPEPHSLYFRLGGNRGIATFARDLFGRAIAHQQLGRFWKGRSTYGVLREERFLVAFLSSVVGGPAQYVGREMKSAHRGLGITPSDWEAFRVILQETLEALRVPQKERQEVVDFAESLRSDIVEG
jgi:DNA-binding NtrC family response regulator/truncated hemoglobin YjbI